MFTACGPSARIDDQLDNQTRSAETGRLECLPRLLQRPAGQALKTAKGAHISIAQIVRYCPFYVVPISHASNSAAARSTVHVALRRQPFLPVGRRADIETWVTWAWADIELLYLEGGMNIRMKRAMIAAGIGATLALPMAGQASDGTITFTGAVTASTCTLSINGAANAGTATVGLPTVDTAALTNAAPRTTAAGTFFSIGVTGCVAAADIGGAAPTQVSIYFEAGPNVDETTGGLINTVVGSNVEVNLYNASGASIVGTQIKPGTPTNQPAAQLVANGGTQWFYAGYSTAGANAAASAGAVSTSITYSLVYQ
jgi:major type 1 subunit fimbrin (pilin)